MSTLSWDLLSSAWLACRLPFSIASYTELNCKTVKGVLLCYCAGYRKRHSQRQHYWYHRSRKGIITNSLTLTVPCRVVVQSKPQAWAHSFHDCKRGTVSWFMWKRGIKHPEYSKTLQWSKRTCSNCEFGMRHCCFHIVVAKIAWNTSLVNDYSPRLHLSAEEWSSIWVYIPLPAALTLSIFPVKQVKDILLAGQEELPLLPTHTPHSLLWYKWICHQWIKLSLKYPQWWHFLCTDHGPAVHRLCSS